MIHDVDIKRQERYRNLESSLMKDLKEMSLKELLESLMLSDSVCQEAKEIIRASLAEVLEAEGRRQKPETAKEEFIQPAQAAIAATPTKLEVNTECEKINLDGDIFEIFDVDSIDGNIPESGYLEDAETWFVYMQNGDVYAVDQADLDSQTVDLLKEFIQTM